VISRLTREQRYALVVFGLAVFGVVSFGGWVLLVGL
jgi:hypothetical protein